MLVSNISIFSMLNLPHRGELTYEKRYLWKDSDHEER